MPAHCEGNLLLGRTGLGQVDVIVERRSRSVQMVALPANREATTIRNAIATKIVELPFPSSWYRY